MKRIDGKTQMSAAEMLQNTNKHHFGFRSMESAAGVSREELRQLLILAVCALLISILLVCLFPLPSDVAVTFVLPT